MQGYVDTIWMRTRQLRIGFLAGLIVGLLAGWFFHGVISFFVRFFFVMVLLIPFVVALIAWWRLRREVRRVRGPRDDWDDGMPYPTESIARGRSRRVPGEPMDPETVITVESWDTWETPQRHGAASPGPEEASRS